MWMLYVDFIYRLRDLAHRWPWWITPDGEIRAVDNEMRELDPITAMVAITRQRYIDLGSVPIAAAMLGLDAATADILVAATDLVESYNAAVRADLVDALRLSEPWGRQGRWGDPAFHTSCWPHAHDRAPRGG